MIHTACQERTRITLPDGREPYIVITTTLQGLRGMYMLCKKFDTPDPITGETIPYIIIRGKTKDNKALSKQFVNRLYSLYTEDEALAFLEGKFVNLSTGRVYPEYDSKRHIYMPFPITTDDILYVGQDFNCLAADTPIYTQRGIIRIADIIVGDYVLGPYGFREVLHHVYKGEAPVYNVAGIRATKEHPFVINGEVVTTDSLRRTKLCRNVSEYQLSLMMTIEKLYCLMDTDTPGIRCLSIAIIESILLVVRRVITKLFILLCGSGRMALFQRAMLFITRTVTRNTTVCKTLKLWLGDSTLGSIDLIQLMRQTTIGAKCKERCLLERILASIVGNSLRRIQSTLSQTSVRSLTVNELEIDISPSSTESVYDIEIDSPDHLFYAGGLLCHNSGYCASQVFTIRNEVIYLVDEYHFKVVGDAARQLRQLYPYNKLVMIPDASAKEILNGFMEELDEAGVELIMNIMNPSITERILAVNKLFRTGRLYVFDNCKKSILALETRGFDDNGKPAKGKGPDALDHSMDASEYAIWHIIHSVVHFDDLIEVLSVMGTNRRKRTAGDWLLVSDDDLRSEAS